MLAFATISLLLGIAFLFGPLLGPFAIWPPPPVGLGVFDRFGGLHLWGGVWVFVGAVMVWGAFREDQARPLALFSFMCAIWGGGYAYTFIRLWIDGHPTGLWLSAALFFALVAASVGVGRLVNAPPLKMDRIKEILDRLEGREDDGGIPHPNGGTG